MRARTPSFFVWLFRTAAQDADAPKNESLAEHLKHCKAKKECPFVKKASTEAEREDNAAKPKGDSSVVTAEEDAAYLKAVSDGDMATCAKMVRAAAEKAMPNLINNYDGNPSVFYHGTSALFNEFAPVAYENDDDYAKKYFYFTTEKSRAESLVKNRDNPRVLSVFLTADNIERIDFDGADWFDGPDGDIDSFLDNHPNVDAVRAKNVLEADGELWDECVVRNPFQIKSADPVTYDDDGNVIPLSRRFDKGTDIRGAVSK